MIKLSDVSSLLSETKYLFCRKSFGLLSCKEILGAILITFDEIWSETPYSTAVVLLEGGFEVDFWGVVFGRLDKQWTECGVSARWGQGELSKEVRGVSFIPL